MKNISGYSRSPRGATASRTQGARLPRLLLGFSAAYLLSSFLLLSSHEITSKPKMSVLFAQRSLNSPGFGNALSLWAKLRSEELRES